MICGDGGVDEAELKGYWWVEEVADLVVEGFAFGAEEAEGEEEDKGCDCKEGVDGVDDSEEGGEAGEVDLMEDLLEICSCSI